MTPVLLLAPSTGLGGGIERYVATVEAAFTSRAVPYRRIDLATAQRPGGLRAKLRFVSEVAAAVRGSPEPVRLVLAHGFLAPVIRRVAGTPTYDGATVILHGGGEIWTRRGPRGARVLRRDDVRVVAVSNFSAGALARTCPAAVLHPGVSPQWYEQLVAAGERMATGRGALRLVTSFRLSSWRSKGLETLLEAVRLVGPRRIRLTVCGSGPVPEPLRRAVAHLPWCRLLPDLPDPALAEVLADADLFVLATRTRPGSGACGEGFGLVLLEAQLAGIPVVAPAYGGSAEAFQPGRTGVSPFDQSADALATVLRELSTDRARLVEMGQAAARWSRSRFEPAAYAGHIVRSLLGTGADQPPGGVDSPGSAGRPAAPPVGSAGQPAAPPVGPATSG